MALDEIDRRILEELQADGRLSNIDLADRVGLSATPCLRRVARLRETGVIERTVALVDGSAVGRGFVVFAAVKMKAQIRAAVDEFETAVALMPEVLECYLMAGEDDYLLKVATADLDGFHRFLTETLTLVPCVANIKTLIPMKQIKHTTALPLQGETDR